MKTTVGLALLALVASAHAVRSAGTSLVLTTAGFGTDDWGNTTGVGDELLLGGPDGEFLPYVWDSVSAGGGFAFGYASLDSGKIGALAKSVKSTPEDFPYHNMPFHTQADVDLWETLGFDNPTTDTVYQPFSIHIDGFFSDAKPDRQPWEWSAYADLYAYLSVDDYVQNVHFDTSGHWSKDFTIDAGFYLTPGHSVHTVKYGLGLYAMDGATSDFSHTLTPTLNLLPGVSFTSSSGRYLQAVPEPGSFIALGAGLLGLLRRRKTPRSGG